VTCTKITERPKFNEEGRNFGKKLEVLILDMCEIDIYFLHQCIIRM
jgi:hypothetical protein